MVDADSLIDAMAKESFTPKMMLDGLISEGVSKEEAEKALTKKGFKKEGKIVNAVFVASIVLLVASIAVFFYFIVIPSLDQRKNIIDEDWSWVTNSSAMDSEGGVYLITYESEDMREYEGVLRDYRVFDGDEEMVTMVNVADFVLGLGDYGDPSKTDVQINSFVGGRGASYKPKTSPVSGSIMVIHAVPQNKEVYEKMINIEKNKQTKFIGKEVSSIEVTKTVNGQKLKVSANKLTFLQSYIISVGICNVSVIYDVTQE